MDAYRILITERQPELLTQLDRFLTAQGIVVLAVHDDKDALDLAVRERPDLLVLDAGTPAGNRDRDRIAMHPALVMTPLIYTTPDPSPEILHAAAIHGATALLHKPFRPETLLAVVRHAMMLYGAGEADAA